MATDPKTTSLGSNLEVYQHPTFLIHLFRFHLICRVLINGSFWLSRPLSIKLNQGCVLLFLQISTHNLKQLLTSMAIHITCLVGPSASYLIARPWYSILQEYGPLSIVFAFLRSANIITCKTLQVFNNIAIIWEHDI